MTQTNPMPVLFVGHGSPMNAIETNDFTRALENLAQKLPTPQAVCVISAHWVTSGTHVLKAAHPETLHDFYGFPRALYEVQYPAPGAVREADLVAQDLRALPDETWGLDHGAWSVLRHMYPQANIPVFQVSLDQTRSFSEQLELGRELRSLRQKGVLILGSGNLVHNLRAMQGEENSPPFDWTREFDTLVKDALDRRDAEALAHPDRWGDALFATAHPSTEHYLPILYCQGSSTEKDTVSYPYTAFNYASLSMRMVLFQ